MVVVEVFIVVGQSIAIDVDFYRSKPNLETTCVKMALRGSLRAIHKPISQGYIDL
jgi:hypothetical protein